MGKRILLEQGTQEWHDFRRNHIGSSDAPVIMNCSPWKKKETLWKEKVSGETSGHVSDRMRRGTDLEKDARLWFNQSHDYVEPAVYVHESHDWMAASFDGISHNGKLAVEIKCPGKEDHALAIKGMVPMKYVPQLQHQMAVASLNEMYYVSYQVDEQPICFKVKRDQDYIDKLIKAELEFWNSIQTLTAPDDGYQDMTEDFAWSIAQEDYMMAYNEYQLAEKKKDEAKDRLIELAQGKPTKGSMLKLSKVVSKGRINYNAIPELKAIDLEKYRSPETETFRIDRI
jgi:putative phage-type endonuclease